MSDSINPIGAPDDTPVDSAALQQQAPAFIPPTTGQVLGASFAQSFSETLPVSLFRAGQRAISAQGTTDPETGVETQAPDPTVPKDQLNKEFGIPGVLSFDQDTTAAVAQSLHDHHVAEIQRNDILQRNVSSIATGGLARFLAGTAASLLDPLNIAATFVPGLPEARVAAMLGDAAQGAAGRLAVRAITGASQGIVGGAALLPAQYGLATAQQDDWDMGSALSSVLMGGVIGGVLHSGLGLIDDRRGLPEWAQSIADTPRSLQEDMTKGAIASIVEDQPRPIDQLIGIHNDLKDMQAELLRTRDDGNEEYARELMGYGPEDAPPGFGDAMDQAAEDVRQGQQETGTEHARFYDPYTDSVLQPEYVSQTEANAHMTGDLVKRLYRDQDAFIIQHSHPTEGSLSPKDLLASGKEGAAAVVAHTPGDNVYIGRALEPDGLAGWWDTVWQTLRPELDQIRARGEYGQPGTTAAAGENYSAEGSDLINRVLDYSGKIEYTSTRKPSAAGLAAAEDVAKRIWGDAGPTALNRLSRTVSKQEAMAELRGRAESVARTRRGDTFLNQRRAAYYEALAQRLEDRVAEITQSMRDAGQRAQAIADAQRPAIDAEQQRQMRQRIADGPEITGDPVKDLAAVQEHDQQFQRYVQQEKLAGRWDDADDRALEQIKTQQALGDGDARAAETAASCVARNLSNA